MLTLESLDIQNKSPEVLGELLIEAKKAYYTGGKPIMDDHTYDTLEEILRQKLPYHRIFSNVGHDNFDTGWEKKKHAHPMSSQNKVNTFNELVHYFELKKVNISEFVVQPKCDGISLEIEYKNGQLVDATTRGDGQVGDIITQNVVKMQGFVATPVLSEHSESKGFSGSVRCEIVVTKKDFAKLNKTLINKDLPPLSRGGAEGGGVYSNPRNAASGLSQRLDSKYSEYCSLYAVDLFVGTHYNASLLKNEIDKITILNRLGFTTVESHLCLNFADIEKIYQKFLLSQRLSYPYDIDGLVVKINDLNVASKLGQLNNRPKFQVAYKFPASTNLTVIKSVAWQVGPMGTITPVAQVDPIELSGAIITFASLANYDLIKKKNLNLNDIVEISRRGDVIPLIEKVITKVSPGHLTIPTNCPDCGTALTVEDKFLKCPNSGSCLSQILGCLRLFCDTLEILGLSDKTIAKLYHSHKVRLPGDFYQLKVDDISGLDNLGEKSAKNILHQIDKKRTLSLVEIFDSATIPHFSQKRILQLVKAGFDTPEKLLHLQTSDLLPLKGFQQTLAEKIVSGINLRHPWIDSILSNVTIHKSYSINHKSLSNLSFCITGTLSQPRKDLEKQILSLGGTVHSSVSKNTSYLICNSPSASDKYQNALKYHTPIINEVEFDKLALSI